MTESRWQAGRIPDTWRRELVSHADDRGSFAELWRSSWLEELGISTTSTGPPVAMAQANLSRSAKGVLRGLHFHERQRDLWMVLEGRAFVGLVDLRAVGKRGTMVPTDSFELTPGHVLYIPEGVAHGFLALEPLTLVYLVTNEYDGTDEHGFAWDDPLAAVPWPTGKPILSTRDVSNPPLKEVLDRLGSGHSHPET